MINGLLECWNNGVLGYDSTLQVLPTVQPFTKRPSEWGGMNAARSKIPTKRPQSPTSSLKILWFSSRLRELQEKKCGGAVLLDRRETEFEKAQLARA
jgi:hypothetical protein